jgi:hypothetical protein
LAILLVVVRGEIGCGVRGREGSQEFKKKSLEKKLPGGGEEGFKGKNAISETAQQGRSIQHPRRGNDDIHREWSALVELKTQCLFILARRAFSEFNRALARWGKIGEASATAITPQ